MNLEVNGTKKILLVEESQGLSLHTDGQKTAVAISGTTAISWVAGVTPPIINSGTATNPVLGITVGPNGVAAYNDSRIAGALQASLNLSDVASVPETRLNLNINNVNNTSDVDKPISTATQTVLNQKLDTATAASTYVPLSDSRLTNQRVPTDGSVTSAKIVSGGLPTSAITGTAVITTDSRLSNSRTPTAHKSTHVTGGSDAIAPADIGAATADHTHTEIDNNLSMHGNKVTNLGAATDPEDAVNKQYVDRVAVGLNVHPSVLYTTTDTITLSGLTNQSGKIDAPSSFAAGKRILVKDQAKTGGNAKDNGIWIAASGSWSRATDMDGTGIANWRSTVNGVVGAYIFVDSGVNLGGSSWFANVTNVGTESIGTDPINFNKFASVNLTAGNGINLSGGSISVELATSNSGLDNTNGLYVVPNPTNPTITVGSAGLSVNYNASKALTATSSGLEIKTGSGISIDPSNGLYINTGAITNAMLNGGIDLTSKVINALPIANGGTNATTASGARTNLGLGTIATHADTDYSLSTHTHTFRTTQSFAIQGNIITSDPTTGLAIPSFFVSKTTNQTTNLVKIIYKIASGTSVQFWINQNGTQISPVPSGNPLSPNYLTATTTKQFSTLNLPKLMTDEDEISLYIYGISGTPKNLSVTLVFEHVVPTS
jgi:hypothetical protein